MIFPLRHCNFNMLYDFVITVTVPGFLSRSGYFYTDSLPVLNSPDSFAPRVKFFPFISDKFYSYKDCKYTERTTDGILSRRQT